MSTGIRTEELRSRHRRKGCARACSRVENLLSPAGGHLGGLRDTEVFCALLFRHLAADRRRLRARL